MLLTLAQVATRLGISKSYCTLVLRRHGVPAVRLGYRTVRYRIEDIDALIANLAARSEGEQP